MCYRKVARLFSAAVIVYACLGQAALTSAETRDAAKPFSALELRKLAEPVALYPDRLLQHMLPASTFPDQIIDAALQIKTAEDAKLIAKQNWDPSVKTVAAYPGILSMMYERLSWTTDLGDAFLAQRKELFEAIQNLRAQAREAGNLESTGQQKVSAQKAPSGETVIIIEPADPQVIYVPTSHTTVYTETSSSSGSEMAPLVTFGVGLALGAALADDDDDHYYRYPYPVGPAAWYNDSPYNQWVEHRHDMWEDYNERAWDKQEFRQDQAADRQDFHQDQAAERQDFRQSYAEEGQKPTKSEAQNFANMQSAERQEFSSAQREERKSQSQPARSNVQSAKSSAAERGWSRESLNAKAGTYSAAQDAGSSAFANFSSGSTAEAYKNRGNSSRASASQWQAQAGQFSASRGSFSSAGARARSGGGRRR